MNLGKFSQLHLSSEVSVEAGCPHCDTGRERLIRSHSSARFCFELSRNSN